jgi:hypothetical protein
MSFKFPLLGFALVAALTGCVVSSNAPTPAPTIFDVTLNIDFAGNPSCLAAGVDHVRATFQNDTLQSTTVPCDSASGIAINYQGVAAGSYTVLLEGLGNGTPLFAGQSTFTVDFGTPTNFSFDLPSSTTSTTTLTTNFTFAAPAGSTTGGMTCAEAGVTDVTITVDNDAPSVVPCHDASSDRDAAALTGIPAGTHSVQFEVTDSQGHSLYYAKYDGVQVKVGSNEYDINVAGAMDGGLQLQWVFSNASTCAAAGVASIDYTLLDPTGRQVKTASALCADSTGKNGAATFSAATGNALPAGVYSLSSMVGRDASNNPIYSVGGQLGGLYVPAGALQAFQVTLKPSP